jgi:mono/diheme cytochrome c family protein
MLRYGSVFVSLGFVLASARPVSAGDGSASGPDSDRPASYSKDVRPILNRSCVACHKPGKLKGKLDLTAYAPFRAGGKTGPAFVPGEPGKSLVVEQVSGPEPAMPDKGEPLTPDEVATLSRWIRQGAKDDSPAGAVAHSGAPAAAGAIGAASTAAAPPGPPPPAAAPVYHVAPVITAIAWSPDGKHLAVAGSHEVLIHQADGGGLVRRVPSGSPRTTSLLYSPDGRYLIAGGGAPGQFGQVQVWDASAADYAPLKNWQVATDLPLGLSLSPAGDRLAFGGADRTVRVIAMSDGRELLKVEQHSDWVFGAAFSADGAQLVTGGRDKSVKLLDASSGQFVDQLNDPQDPVTCLARHPAEPLVACGTAQGTTRLYRMTDLKKRTEQNRDPNLARTLDRLPGAVNALAFSPDGALLAVAGTGEARIYSPKDGRRVSTLSGSPGPVFAIAFDPSGKKVVVAGFDGQVRIFATEKGQLLTSFVPLPVEPSVGGPSAPTQPPDAVAK